MPKPRKADKLIHCSFCGTHKDDTALLVSNTHSKCAICSTCALAVVEQTFAAMMRMEQMIRQASAPPVNPMKIVRPEDKTDESIRKAEEGSIITKP